MGKSSERKRQQKRAKHNKKRKQRKQDAVARKQASSLPTSERGLVSLASKGAFGPVWISEGWQQYDWDREPLIVLLTRQLRGATLLPYALWVDRWLRGVEEAAVLAPVSELELRALVTMISEDEGRPLVPCELAEAQSLVLHALAQAERFGLKPHRSYSPAMLEPRPSPLLETFGARRERPVFIRRSEGDTARMIRHIMDNVGLDNIDVLSGEAGDLESFADCLSRTELSDFADPDDPLANAYAPEFFEDRSWEPEDHTWLPGDVGDDPSRINWRAACSECFADLRFMASEDAWLYFDDTNFQPEWQLHDDIEAFADDLREGRYLVWEAQLRRLQGLGLSEEQARALAEPAPLERARLVQNRPVEPWYQTLERMLERLTEPTPDGEDRRWLAIHARQCLDWLTEAAPVLSLPAGVTSLAQLLDDERVSQIRVRAIVDILLALVDSHEPVSLADPEQAFRIQRVAEGLEAEARHLERLGWGLEKLLEPIGLPASERKLLLEGL